MWRNKTLVVLHWIVIMQRNDCTHYLWCNTALTLHQYLVLHLLVHRNRLFSCFRNTRSSSNAKLEIIVQHRTPEILHLIVIMQRNDCTHYLWCNTALTLHQYLVLHLLVHRNRLFSCFRNTWSSSNAKLEIIVQYSTTLWTEQRQRTDSREYSK